MRLPMGWRGGRRADERGAVLVLAAVGIVLAMIAAALAIDLGRAAADARRDQKVADLAALDAVRNLANAQSVATASATRNQFPTSAGYSVTATVGKLVTGTFQADPTGDSVQVAVTSPFKNQFPFVGAGNSVTRKSVASLQDRAGFELGSSLVTLDSSRVTLLNPLVGQMISASGASLGLSLVSWQGLAAGSVTLDQIRMQLVSMGFSVGTVSQLLGTQLTLAQFFQATANALTAKGDAADANVFNILKVAATSNVKFTMGQFINVAQGADGLALSSTMNLFQLATASAEASAVNGGNFLDVSNIAITVPGVSSTKLHLKVISPPVTYIGPKGGSVSTGQVQLTVTPTLNLNVTLGLSVLNVKNDLPINITAAGATGTMKDIRCTINQGITVTVDPQAFSGSAAITTLRVYTLGLPVLDVQTTTITPSTDGGASDLVFNFPSEFWPPAASKHAGSQPVGLKTLTQTSTGTVTLLGGLPLGVTSGQIVSAVLAALPGLLNNVDNNILTPTLTGLGLDVGSADVTALASDFTPANCGQPSLVK